MSPRELVNEAGQDSEILTADGFDDALMGLVEGWHPNGERFTLAVYDRDKCIQILVAQGMSDIDAEDHFSYNVEGAYVGPGTPCFARLGAQ